MSDIIEFIKAVIKRDFIIDELEVDKLYTYVLSILESNKDLLFTYYLIDKEKMKYINDFQFIELVKSIVSNKIKIYEFDNCLYMNAIKGEDTYSIYVDFINRTYDFYENQILIPFLSKKAVDAKNVMFFDVIKHGFFHYMFYTDCNDIRITTDYFDNVKIIKIPQSVKGDIINIQFYTTNAAIFIEIITVLNNERYFYRITLEGNLSSYGKIDIYGNVITNIGG